MCREQYHAYSYYEMSGTASCGQWSSIQIQYNVHHPVAHSKGVTVKRWHTIPSMLLLRGEVSYAMGTMGFVRGGAD